MAKRFILLLGLILFTSLARATHNRAGEITYRQIDDLTMEVTVVTYTKGTNAADRPFLTVDWGDGTSQDVARVNNNGSGLLIGNDTKINFYVEVHTYPGRSRYTISVTDPNRNGNILNVNPPNSITIPFYIETTFTILSPQFQGKNSSAILLQPPIDVACIGQKFIHNPNAFDPEGDSLAYEWTIPRAAVDMDVPNYIFPDKIEPGSNNKISLNEVTGDIIWDAPQKAGEYNIAFKIKEYRGGVLLNTIVRDMQILVLDCENRPPTIEAEEEVCVEAYEDLNVSIVATDPDVPMQNQKVKLTALGAPLDFTESPAVFESSGQFDPVPAQALLRWRPICDHIREEKYQVIVKAEDDFFSDRGGLVDLKTINIQVVGPPPENLLVEPLSMGNELRWDYPYVCLPEESDNFQGFTIWRKSKNDNVTLGDCNTDLSTKGYTAIATVLNEDLSDPYIFLDETSEFGQIYCYRVTALFGRTTDSGQLFNVVQSKPSNFGCVNIRKDIPFIVKTSVNSTSEDNGQIVVEWIPPALEDLDIDLYPPPYTFELYRRNELLNSETYTSYQEIPEKMSYLDNGLNTMSEQQEYSVRLLSNSNEVGNSLSAQSIFLQLSTSEKGFTLSWDANVPWSNDEFEIFRKEENQTNYISLDKTSNQTYTDSKVRQNQKYCYYITSYGQYFFVDYDNIINNSQEICQVYDFLAPPSAPIATIKAECGDTPQSKQDSFQIVIEWTLQQEANNTNLSGFNIYEIVDSTKLLITSAPLDENARSYIYSIPHGRNICVAVQAIGDDNSLSPISDTQCFLADDSCSDVELPNTFTPNGDGVNDKFKPISYNFVNGFEFTVFNRWGNKIFETSDIEINWDGLDSSGKEVSKGVYFYEMTYDYSNKEGKNLSKTFTGFIELLK